MIEEIEEAIEAFVATGKFMPRELVVDEKSRDRIVRMRGNPQRFVASIFDGEWAEPGAHPQLGTARLLRVLSGNDGVSRGIMRQGRALFVYPMI